MCEYVPYYPSMVFSMRKLSNLFPIWNQYNSLLTDQHHVIYTYLICFTIHVDPGRTTVCIVYL